MESDLFNGITQSAATITVTFDLLAGVRSIHQLYSLIGFAVLQRLEALVTYIHASLC